MLQGNKVGLRAVEKNELEQLLTWRNQPGFRKYFREYRELNGENQRMWFEKFVMQDKNTEMFAIVELENNQLIGACGLCYIDWINRNADFSIYIGKDNLYVDAVYAINAAEMMIQYGFDELNLHRLWAEIYDFDEEKKKMFVTLGFSLEGRHRQTHWTEGKWCDSLYYGLIK